MPYGPVTVAVNSTADAVPPGAPTLVSIEQEPGNNATITLRVMIPNMDSEPAGSPGNLSGLTKFTVGTIAENPDGTSPIEGMTVMEEILKVPDIREVSIPLTMADAGTEKEIDVPIVNLGGNQILAFACAD